MEELITYIYKRYINSIDPKIQGLSKGETIKISQLTQDQMIQFLPLIAKNILIYSNANLQLKLSTQNLFAFHRLHKFEKIMIEEQLEQVFNTWINHEMFPFVFPSKKIPSTPYVFIDKTNESQEKDIKGIYMINIPELTKKLLKNYLRQIFGSQQVKLDSEFQLNKAIEQAKWIKFEEYVSQRFDQDTLMVMNFIVKYPFMQEKQLLRRTLLKLTDLRKCINNLVTQGMISFYPQTSRIMVFQASKRQKLLENFKDIVAATLLNSYIKLQDQVSPQKRNKLYTAISQMDDILLLF